jgi:hypothetical protein
MGGVFDCRCRNRPILAAFAADKGGVRIEDSKIEDSKIEDSKTGLARYLARHAEAAEDSDLKPAIVPNQSGHVAIAMVFLRVADHPPEGPRHCGAFWRVTRGATRSSW